MFGFVFVGPALYLSVTVNGKGRCGCDILQTPVVKILSAEGHSLRPLDPEYRCKPDPALMSGDKTIAVSADEALVIGKGLGCDTPAWVRTLGCRRLHRLGNKKVIVTWLPYRFVVCSIHKT